jgi:2-polyprenyl-3-methyl-5-hydroxy-6-metoxy-1,4-benzoquinol methylase
MNSQALDQKKAEKFAEKMIGVLNGGALALMTSIGHRTGLFDILADLPHSTSQQIADATGLNERYVREWLGAMVVGGIIDYDPRDRTYTLPQEHAAALTRAASPNNLATTAQFISLLGNVEDQIVESFRKGGGVPYSAFPRFHELMAEESNQTVVAALIDHILPLAPGMIERLNEGIEVLDVGCGSGNALILMARMFPKSRFTGFDFSEEAIARARAEADRLGLSNINFEAKDVATLNGGPRFKLITAFDAIHDQADPARVLSGISNALLDDGIFLMQDIAGSSHLDKNYDHPVAPFLYTISCMHCMTVSLAQNGAGLGTMWGLEKASQMLADAGFTKLEVKQLPHDIMNNYFIAAKGQKRVEPDSHKR